MRRKAKEYERELRQAEESEKALHYIETVETEQLWLINQWCELELKRRKMIRQLGLGA